MYSYILQLHEIELRIRSYVGTYWHSVERLVLCEITCTKREKLTYCSDPTHTHTHTHTHPHTHTTHSLVDAVSTVCFHDREAVALCMSLNLITHVPIPLTWTYCVCVCMYEGGMK